MLYIHCPPNSQVINAAGHFLAPGFTDLQINGAFSHDFTDNPASIWAVGSQLPRYGVTSFLPTIITSPPETIAAAQEVIAQGPPADYAGAIPLGLHIEGPFLNRHKKGAHHTKHLQPPNQNAIRN